MAIALPLLLFVVCFRLGLFAIKQQIVWNVLTPFTRRRLLGQEMLPSDDLENRLDQVVLGRGLDWVPTRREARKDGPQLRTEGF